MWGWIDEGEGRRFLVLEVGLGSDGGGKGGVSFLEKGTKNLQ